MHARSSHRRDRRSECPRFAATSPRFQTRGPGFAGLGAFVLAGLLVVLVCHAAEWQDGRSQTDWSAGPGVDGPTADWGSSFAASEGVSWLAVAGQLSLAGSPLAAAIGHPLDPAAPGALKVFAADVDADGDMDVLVGAYYEDTITLWHNLGGSPPQWRPGVIASRYVHPGGLSAADVDRDGRIDLLGAASDDREVTWWRNLGGDPPGWERLVVSDSVAGGVDVVAADLDLDGDTDLVVPAYEDDELLWFGNDGGDPIQWTRQLIVTGWDYPCKAAVADLDQDGDLDVVAVAWLAQEVAWWRNDGGEPLSWSRQTIVENLPGAHWVDSADVDGDGRVDVVTAAIDLGQVAWWRNLGGSPIRWERHIVTSTVRGAVSVRASDLDGDGDVDVAASGWDADGGVFWFENRGSGLTWWRHDVDPSFGESSSVTAADVDGDGALDLLGTSWSRNEARWWQLTEPQDHGMLTSSILDTGGHRGWSTCEWDGEAPAGAQLALEARASDDPRDLGQWTEISPGDLSWQLAGAGRYLQYRVLMSRGSAAASPSLRSVEVTWTSHRLPPPRRPGGRVPVASAPAASAQR